jgi:hypothetical protein
VNNHLTPDVPMIAATVPALTLVGELAAKYPQLPAPYLVFSTHEAAVYVSLQCPTLDAFEAWREALDVRPAAVTLFASMINADLPTMTVNGVKVKVQLYVAALSPLNSRPRSEWETFLAAAVLAEVNVEVDEDGPDDCIGIPEDWRVRRAALEDPHSSELHHDYALGHDLPTLPHQRNGEAL